jgi:2-polyprenyl-6-methoxyphenol hydroxylase-like FAD-dependent oxidoreductase
VAAAGFYVKVFETASHIDALGLGIHLQPNSVRELIELGLGDALASQAVAIEDLAFCNRHGQFVWREPRGFKAGYRWPQYAINRGTLQVTLLDAVRERIGADNIFTGHRLLRSSSMMMLSRRTS